MSASCIVSGVAFYTYITTNKRNGTLYCGHTEHLSSRVIDHRDGTYGGFSSRYGLNHLVWFDVHDSREGAFRRERRIKKWNRNWKLALIEQTNPYWLSITDCVVWPVPKVDNDLMATMRAQCLAQSLDPRLRGDERYEEENGPLPISGWEDKGCYYA